MSSSPASLRCHAAPSLAEALNHDPALKQSVAQAFARGDVAVIGPAEFAQTAKADQKPTVPRPR